jgi:hypothetical protein
MSNPKRRNSANQEPGESLHGDSAARRQAVTELLFFSSVGDLARCQRICASWRIDVSRHRFALAGPVGLFGRVCLPAAAAAGGELGLCCS